MDPTAKSEYDRKRYQENPEYEKQRRREWRRTPKGRYCDQRIAAAVRGIPFLLTFDEWWALWKPHWNKRGRYSKQKVMARFGDSGPYAWGNVEIKTSRENHQERQRGC